MATQTDTDHLEVRHEIQFPASDYTFPSDDSIHNVRFDDDYVHVELVDGRLLSIPLQWMPTLLNASPEARETYEINAARTAIIWDPDTSGINDELCIATYLQVRGPSNG